MECLATFIALATLATVVFILTSFARTPAKRQQQLFRQLARRYGGRMLPSGWFGLPGVRLQYGDATATVNVVRLQKREYVEVRVPWQDPLLRLEVLPQSLADSTPVLLGTTDMTSGNESFDEIYVLRGSDEARVRRVLSEGVQWQIERLRHLFGSGTIYVSIINRRLLVRKQHTANRYEQVEELVRLALELYDQAMLTCCEGIEFLDTPLAQPLQEATCQVCGEYIITDLVFCYRCKTPHHEECWQYYGACTTYGCQETRCITPQIARPLEPHHDIRKHPKPR